MQKVSIAKICSITGIYYICCDNEKLFAFRNEEMATNISGRFAVKKKRSYTHVNTTFYKQIRANFQYTGLSHEYSSNTTQTRVSLMYIHIYRKIIYIHPRAPKNLLVFLDQKLLILGGQIFQ